MRKIRWRKAGESDERLRPGVGPGTHVSSLESGKGHLSKWNAARAANGRFSRFHDFSKRHSQNLLASG